MNKMDTIIAALDRSLRVISGVAQATRPNPAHQVGDTVLTEAERRHSAGLMRVNHVGEVCAQALYQAQAQFAGGNALVAQFDAAAKEEEDHLAWTTERINELNSHTSALNPLWFVGSYLLGAVAARLGDARSLGFVVETERQVEAHLTHHLSSLPENDVKSRAIVTQMRSDEAAHGAAANAMGAADVPWPVRQAMQVMSKVMTTTAYYV